MFDFQVGIISQSFSATESDITNEIFQNIHYECWYALDLDKTFNLKGKNEKLKFFSLRHSSQKNETSGDVLLKIAW